MRQIVKIIAFALVCVGLGFAQNVYRNNNLSKDNVSSYSLKNLVSSDYQANVDDDGDIKISDGQWNVYLFIDSERKLIKFSSFWEANSDISDNRSYKIASKFEEGHIFTRTFFSRENKSKPGRFFLQYYMIYSGGISAENLNEALRWYFILCKDLNTFLKEEDAL